jgi:hypothetical protein
MSAMLSVVVTAVLSFEGSSPNESAVLEGISRAFFRALDEDSSAFVMGVWGALGVAAAWVIAGWIRGDALSRQRERRELEQRRERIASEAPPRLERREWLRVPATLTMKVAPVSASPLAPAEVLETCDVGGGGLSFLSDRPPRRGARLRFTLDLGERRPLAVRGAVVRVSPPRQSGAPSLVGVRFAEVDDATRERLVMWVAQESRRGIIAARRGRLCAGCERPLADGADDMHPTCAARLDHKQAA